MKILVVRTCDGDMYYRKSQWKAATEMSAQQVCVNDLSRWESDDLMKVRTQAELKPGNHKGLYEACLSIRAIYEAEVL